MDAIKEDVEDIIERLGDKWRMFRGKTILITGATGLIGSMLARVFVDLNKKNNMNAKIILVVRDKERAKLLFGDELVVYYAQADITEPLEITDNVDYIVHTASPANSKHYVEEPVETVEVVFDGSKRLLELAKEKEVDKIVLLSTMEVYGEHLNKEVDEDEQGYLDIYNVRNSYSIGKRTAEYLAYAFFSEYKVPAVSMRLAMCFGPGQKKDDRRVHKIFCDAALSGQDVEVRSSGKTVVNFVYSADAILAIMYLLLDGEAGNSYNVAGDALDYTIMDMAKYIARKNDVEAVHNYSPETRFESDNAMRLSTGKIQRLGWKPKYNIEVALDRYLDYLKTI